jgi:uncharacterized membrane protein SpoIIM required for sporulation
MWLLELLGIVVIGSMIIRFLWAILFQIPRKNRADLKEQKRLVALGMTPSAAGWKIMEQELRHHRR